MAIQGPAGSLPPDAPTATRNALDAFVDRIQADPRVGAAFIGGSFADDSWDNHSDLDLYVIVEDIDYEAVFADRTELVGAMGTVVLAEDFDGFGFDLVVFMLTSGVEGELAFGRRSSFLHIHGGPYRVLVDRDGVLAGTTVAQSRPTGTQRSGSVRRTLAWFWRQMALFATASARGRIWSAYGYLERARHEALDLVWLLERPDEWPRQFEKIDDVITEHQASRLAQSLMGPDPALQPAAAAALVDFVAEHGRRAAAAVGCDYPGALEATVRRRLARMRDGPSPPARA